MSKKYAASLSVFTQKGFKPSTYLDKNGWHIFVFKKLIHESNNYLEIDKENFIISTGTVVYKRKIGFSALPFIYDDFSHQKDFFNQLQGHYGIIIKKNKDFYLFNDFNGQYHVYLNSNKTIVSSSFLAVLKTIENKTVSIQELYEYVYNEACYGNKTFIREIDLLDSNRIINLNDCAKREDKPTSYSDFNDILDSRNMKERVLESLKEYFSILKENYTNNVCMALTGGFDSRLLFALCRFKGINPYLYVYGADNSQDVRIAKNVTNQENVFLDHINKMNFPLIALHKYSQHIHDQYYLNDGMGQIGIFDNGSDFSTRRQRCEQALVQINGVGGEIFRNFWGLPNKSMPIGTFLMAFYKQVDFSTCTKKFQYTKYFAKFEEKIKTMFHLQSNILDRKQIDMLYPFLRLKYWYGNNTSINSQFAHTLNPFTEPKLFFLSFDIPFHLKQMGFFEAELIKNIDPNIAQYPSAYGFNFSDTISIIKKIRNKIGINSPIALKYLYNKTKNKYRTKRNIIPYYLKKDYLYEIFGDKPLFISEFINIESLMDFRILSRALTVELSLNN